MADYDGVRLYRDAKPAEYVRQSLRFWVLLAMGYSDFRDITHYM